MVTVDELRDAWAEMQRHKQIALLTLDGEDESLAKEHLAAACSILNGVLNRLSFEEAKHG